MHRDGLWVGTRRDVEIIFKLLLVAVVNQVDAGIKPADADLGEHGQAYAPLRGVVAGEVIDFTGQFSVTADRRLRIGADELHPHGCGCGGGFAKHDLGFGRRN